MALDRTIGEHREEQRAERARVARAVGNVGRAIEPSTSPGRGATRWSDSGSSRRSGSAGRAIYGLDHLWLSLEDHGAVLEGLGGGEWHWPWLDSPARSKGWSATCASPPAHPPGRGPARAGGCRRGGPGRHVFLVNLGRRDVPDP